MDVTPAVLGAVFALAFGLIATMRRLKKFRGRYRCFAYAEATVGILAVFSGSMAALGRFHPWWPYLVAAGLAIIPITVLLGRLAWEWRRRRIVGRYYQNFYPDGALKDGMTFTQAVSTAIKQYGRISASNIPLLSFPSLKQTYETVASNGSWLSFEEFKTECLLGLSFDEDKSFREKAALLIFADPSDVAECREWFVRQALLLKLFRAAEGGDLAEIIRLMWKEKSFNAAIRQDCFLDAFYRLVKGKDKAVALALCQKLLEQHGTDTTKTAAVSGTTTTNADADVDATWINREMPKFKAKCGNVEPSRLCTEDELKLDTWYVPGDATECELCGYRCSKETPIWRTTWYGWRKRAPRARSHCEVCNLNAIRPVSSIIPPPPPPPTTEDAASPPSSQAGPSTAGPSGNQCVVDMPEPNTTEITE
ncbi:hypothetical protein PSACC_03368 [Paramicrosporidium saccamoebae]|uniref:Uncharacterized protein n=1 Tax=Paramicrosporidium saccamoebae TaxID=1246581 RepID=A0A2H9TGF5_9FUNG|nr:hypothetical protein PSACC_03368 [Paramicrosporidium saccamoebae]